LPAAVRQYDRSGWKWIAPGVSMQPVSLPKTSKTRAFLLKSARGTSMLQHTHSGLEMTCVLIGNFSHEGGVFQPGDFDYGDASVDHQPIVGGEGDCICLVAMTGELKLKGLLGRVIQPLIRL
jgi:putative transcriptional regulator